MMDDHEILSLPALPLGALLRWQILPLRTSAGELRIACAEAPEAALVAWLDGRLAEPWRWQEWPAGRIEEYLARQVESYRALGELGAGGEAEASEGEAISLDSLAFEENRVVRLVNSTLHDAVADGASDIHFEATREGLAIKFRIDGRLIDVGCISESGGRQQAEQVVSRIKVLADLDIAETRIPQDGRFKIVLAGQGGGGIDFRVSVMPSLHGEDVVLRILDKRRLADEGASLTLSRLGFPDDQAESLRRLAGRPHGMLLVTGPTGSGKTTTLYALLMETASPGEKTIAIEDPAEYQLPGVLQIPVNERKGLTFARGLRSILRHDPDRIMVGEIRDPETAEIAVQAALTGHLVLSSVHANGVFEVVQRFTHMGVDLHALSTCLIGIVAQRLVRLNCPDCREAAAIDDALAGRLGLSGEDRRRLRRGRGCATCRATGAVGRRAVAQHLALDDALREAIVDRLPVRRLKQLAAEQGLVGWCDILRPLLLSGDLSPEEAERALAD
jgi:general secretion pathway protein E